jgi:hypothetical protein
VALRVSELAAAETLAGQMLQPLASPSSIDPEASVQPAHASAPVRSLTANLASTRTSACSSCAQGASFVTGPQMLAEDLESKTRLNLLTAESSALRSIRDA